MSGIWLVSYALLWVLVLTALVLLIGLLQVVGRSDRPASAMGAASAPEFPAIDHDGPEIGSPMPDLAFETLNGFGQISWGATDKATVLVFLSAMCESCHDVVGPLNSLVAGAEDAIRALAIVKGPVQTTEAFLKVYPLHVPVVVDPDMEVTSKRFDVHRNPFALYYEHGTLVRKGTVEHGSDGLRAVLGDPSVPAAALMRVTPPPVSRDERALARS